MASPRYPRRAALIGVAVGVGVAASSLAGCGRSEDFEERGPDQAQPMLVRVDAGVPSDAAQPGPDAAQPGPDASDYLAGGIGENLDVDGGVP
jgi:hypothetical protein